MKLINIGFGNIVSANRLIAIVSPESAPIKRIIQEARDRGMLTAVQPETVAHRLNAKDNADVDDDAEEVVE